MRYIVLTLLVIQIDFISHAQEFAVTLEGENSKILAQAVEEYMAGKEENSKIIPFIFLNESNGTMKCYLGLVNAWWQVEQSPPSYYFLTKSGLPVFVYTGFESNIRPNQKYVDDIKNLCEKFTWGEEVIANIHFQYWYCKIKNGKLMKLRKAVRSKESISVNNRMKRIR